MKAERGARQIYCCGCGKYVRPRLTNGGEIYPHRSDLQELPFWKCDVCDNAVGCHHKTRDRTRPLGCIPTLEIKRARQRVHRVLDPLWQSGRMRRKEIYAELSERLGWQYHTAEIRSVDEAYRVYRLLTDMRHIATTQPRATSATKRTSK